MSKFAILLTLFPFAAQAFTSHKPSFLQVPKKPSTQISMSERYSLADQVARFARAKKENNLRYLDITTVYDPSYLKGKRVAITGANRGLGLALATEVSEAGAQLIAIVRSSSKELDALNPVEVITGVDATNNKDTIGLCEKITGGPIDIVRSLHLQLSAHLFRRLTLPPAFTLIQLINNAGYFRKEVEKLDSLDFADELKTIDICAIGPLRVTSSLVNGGLLKEGSKVVVITSQGGSVEWRPTQCPEGGDYGHHVCRVCRKWLCPCCIHTM
jgi:hypothetical protein